MISISHLLENPFSSRPIQDQIEIKRLGRPTPNLENFASGSRKFQRDIYDKCSWLCGCETRVALFCFPCVLFNGEDTWSKIGFKNLCYLAIRIKEHEDSQAHISNSVKLGLLGENDITEQLDSANTRNIALHNKKVEQNRYVLSELINCIRFCGVFDLASRGYDDGRNPGIFKGLFNFSSELDAVMKNYLVKATAFKGTSKFIQIQNDLLQIMLDVCHEKIVSEMKETEYLAVIAYETSDESNQFQLALVYRYISNNKPVERFWTLINPPSRDAHGLSECIINELKVHKLEENPQKLIAQSYNGASVMAGVSNGVQAKVRALFPDAHYIGNNCFEHQLNLVIAKAASSNRNVRIFFANLQGVCSFFSQLTSISDQTLQSKLSRYAPTGWNFQSRSFEIVYAHWEDFIECMEAILNSEEIKNDNIISQAFVHLANLKKASFILWLSFFQKIVPYVNILYFYYLKVFTNPNAAQKGLIYFENNINKVRNQMMENDSTCDNTESVYQSRLSYLLCGKSMESENDLKEQQKVMVSEYDMEEQQKTFKRIKLDRLEWKRDVIEVCDVIISHMKERFRFIGHFIASDLFASINFPCYEKKFPVRIFNSVCREFQWLNAKKLEMELKTLYSATDFRQISGEIPLHNFIKQCHLEEAFSEILKLLEIIISVPMLADRKEERDFSTLKRITTYLKNSMRGERLSALAMLSIEKDLIMDIPDFNKRVLEKFAGLEEWRNDFQLRCFQKDLKEG